MGLIQGLQGWLPIGDGVNGIGAAFYTAELLGSGREGTGSRMALRGRQNGNGEQCVGIGV